MEEYNWLDYSAQELVECKRGETERDREMGRGLGRGRRERGAKRGSGPVKKA